MHHSYQIIDFIIQKINSFYKNHALSEQYAWWMLEAVTKKKKAHLIVQDQMNLTDTQQATLDFWIEQLTKHHKPLAYILGSVPFGPLTILVEPPILIPRPETEQWCLELISALKTSADYQLNVLDLCTGSGCIALALAHAYPNFTVWGTDKSSHAIVLAKKNAHYNNIHNVLFLESDLFESIAGKKFDLMVTNPPYISFAELPYLDLCVTQWEDKEALFASDDGLSIIKQIITQAPEHFTPQSPLFTKNIPRLWIEIDRTQKDQVVEFMKTAQYSNIQVFKDLSQKNRVVVGSIDVAIASHK